MRSSINFPALPREWATPAGAREVHLAADCGRLLYAASSGSGSPGFSV
jgi:hypothetical protein